MPGRVGPDKRKLGRILVYICIDCISRCFLVLRTSMISKKRFSFQSFLAFSFVRFPLSSLFFSVLIRSFLYIPRRFFFCMTWRLFSRGKRKKSTRGKFGVCFMIRVLFHAVVLLMFSQRKHTYILSDRHLNCLISIFLDLFYFIFFLLFFGLWDRCWCGQCMSFSTAGLYVVYTYNTPSG